MRRTNAFVVVIVLALFACNEPAGEKREKVVEKVEEPTKSEAAEPTEPAQLGGETGETGGEAPKEEDPNEKVVIEAIGIAECDRYIESFKRCVDEHAPDKAPHLATLREQVGAWKQSKAGGGENAVRALPIGCKAAEGAAKAASAEWGCEW